MNNPNGTTTRTFFQSISASPFPYIAACFCASRIVLAIVGVASRGLLSSCSGREFAYSYSKHLWLSIWAVWDSGWYLDIAKCGYSLSLASNLPKAVDPHQINFGFFPLYPIFVDYLSRLLGGHLFASAIIVSNSCLLAGAWFLFKLVRLDHPDEVARRAVFFLFAFPTSFVLSGVLSESLFLCLSILVFYTIRKRKFALAFCIGVLLGLSRPTALFAVPVIFLAYFAERHYDIRKTRISILCCTGVAVGYGLFAFFGWCVTGDWFFYTHLKQAAWGSSWTNPITLLGHCVFSHNPTQSLNGLLMLSGCCCIVMQIRRIGVVYGLLALCLLVLPLAAGTMVIPGMMRYMAAIFPLFIALATVKQDSTANVLLTIACLMLQGFLMVFWTNGFNLII